MTIETTYSQAREQLKSLMDRAVDDREVVMVRRRSGGDVAMIAADELTGLLETAHLLRSEKNAQRLLTALTRARAKNLAPTPLDALYKMVGTDASIRAAGGVSPGVLGGLAALGGGGPAHGQAAAGLGASHLARPF
jgi:antitoxin YefM